jgi:hypothetical protein
MIARAVRPRYRVRIDVPRTDGRREWGLAAGGFERRLAQQESPSVTGPHIESETRRGRDYVRVRVAVTVGAPDLGQAAMTAWGVFRAAAGQDIAGWDMAAASAEIQPEGQARLARRHRPEMGMADPASMGVVAGSRGTAVAAACAGADSGGRARSKRPGWANDRTIAPAGPCCRGIPADYVAEIHRRAAPCGAARRLASDLTSSQGGSPRVRWIPGWSGRRSKRP